MRQVGHKPYRVLWQQSLPKEYGMNMDLLNELDPALLKRIAAAYKGGALVKVAGDGRMYAMREETDGLRGWWVWSLAENGSHEHMVRGDTCTCPASGMCVHLRLVKHGY